MIEAGRVASCAVLVVDLDRFSRVNACLGALAGDELLITVARRIKGALRVRDTLARIGGDEFGILMAIDETPDEADRVAARIRSALEIGRASCRERGCRYGEIAVVAGPLKKKKQ